MGKGQLIEYEQDLGIEGKIPALVEVFKTIHKSVEKISVRFLQELRRHNYVTPTSYLELLNMYRQILVEKKNELRRQSDRLKSGLDKLDSANTEVNKMEKELKVMQPELEKKNVEVGKLMESISIDKEEANKTQKLVAAESEIATQEEKNALEIAEEQEQRCAEANRNLAECLAKVDQLKRDHLTEIKTFTSPTEPVKVVAAGLVILLWPMILKNGGSMIYIQQPGAITKEENYFETMKKYLMGNVLELKEYIKDFNKDEISDKMANKLHEKCISNSNFNFQAVAKSSYAASYLQLWVSAMFSYNKIYKETEPQRKKLEEIKAVVAEKKEILRVKNEELQKINDRIDTLER